MVGVTLITAMLLQYPNVGALQVAWASAFTLVKSWIIPICLILGLGLLLVALLRGGVRAIRDSRGSD